MKVEWRTILGASIFLGATGVIYVAYKNHPTEAAGVVMLVFGFAAYFMLFGFLLLQYFRRRRIPRPEDRFDATHADGEGEIAYFPNASIWPAGMGLGMVVASVGLVWGLWYAIIGLTIFFGAIFGYMTESDAETAAVEAAEARAAEEASLRHSRTE
ncbi:MAG TPA: cytochrome c oxidase subunit 4 [Acidimicrobiales bacterium]|nr:cytochrome c oxidase subunit 4 [Acidimicrobiales bacterium]